MVLGVASDDRVTGPGLLRISLLRLMRRGSRTQAPDGEAEPEEVGHQEQDRYAEDQIVVSAHGGRFPIAIAAAMTHARPPSAPMPVPMAARTLTKVGSDRSSAAVQTLTPIQHKIAATRFQVSNTLAPLS